jgi:hypothetical protein
MRNPFQKHKMLVGGVFILVAIIVTSMLIQNQMKKMFSTPELIGMASATGLISEEERLLYLAYALYEYKSLPTRYLSNVGWDGTPIVRELQEALTPPEVFCYMSPYVRSEFLRLGKFDMTCD